METAKCRGCNRELKGKPYHMGGGATDPDTGERVPVNFYGGYACSYRCDVAICLDISSSMPGAGPTKRLSSLERAKVKENWGD